VSLRDAGGSTSLANERSLSHAADLLELLDLDLLFNFSVYRFWGLLRALGAVFGRGTPHILHFLDRVLLLKVHMLQSHRPVSAFNLRCLARSALFTGTPSS